MMEFHLETTSDGDVRGRLHLPSAGGRRPCVVLCHGFKGFMDWGFFPYLAELLTQRGFVVVRFNLPGAGVLPGEDRVSDTEAFRQATFTKDLRDLLDVLEHTTESLAPERIDPDRIGLLGHSRGGGTALLAAAHPAWIDRIGALTTWSAVSSFDRTSEEQKSLWRRTGELPVVNARTGQELALGIEVLEDLEQNLDSLDLLAAAARRRAPWLIVHGQEDESVDPEDGEALAAAAAGDHELLRISEAGHTFGAVHPFRGPTPQLTQAMNATQTWFRKYLTEAG